MIEIKRDNIHRIIEDEYLDKFIAKGYKVVYEKPSIEEAKTKKKTKKNTKKGED